MTVIKLSEWVAKHAQESVTCKCGAKCNLRIVIDNPIEISAYCLHCDKALTQYESPMLIKHAAFDIVDALIEKFKIDFNKG